MVKHFPQIKREVIRFEGKDRNPGIQLFGRRFYSDQTIAELLSELLLVAISEKRIGDYVMTEEKLFPDVEFLRNWPNKIPLEYAPKACLNLKLFSFLGASKLDTRHETHKKHYSKLINRLQSKERLIALGKSEPTEILRTLENLFLGFQGVGGQRTWCAQSFMPLFRSLIAGESIWGDTKARRDNVEYWQSALDCFSHNQHIFLSRGGELLYLQICNALRQKPETLKDWFANTVLPLSSSEQNPDLVHRDLMIALKSALSSCPVTVDKLATFIDSEVEGATHRKTDFEAVGNRRYTACGWCPSESWPEGYLFAVELLRLCNAAIDPVERLEMMEIACALQLLRSLCAQSARYDIKVRSSWDCDFTFNYVWAISDPDGQNEVVKQISRRNVSAIQRMIHDAIRHSEIIENVKEQEKEDTARGKNWKDPYKNADDGYGHKLFLTTAKRIGLIVPKRGFGARFVINDRILRCMVLSTIRPGERVTYDTFKEILFAHYGVALDEQLLGEACKWSGTQQLSTLGGEADGWLIEMLSAAGMLLRLSDACSLVKNPFSKSGANQ